MSSNSETLFILDKMLQSDIAVIDPLCNEIRNVMEQNKLNDDIFSIEILIRESLNNAILHGNKDKPFNKVHFNFKINPSLIEIVVEDQGEGFDWKSAPRTIGDDDILENGMGLRIYTSYASSVDFNEKGNRVILRKKIVSQIDTNPVSIYKQENKMLIILNCPLTSSNYTKIRESVLQELDPNYKTVVFDLENVSIIDSRGIAFLVSLLKILTASGGSLSIINLSTNLFELLKSINLHRHLDLQKKL